MSQSDEDQIFILSLNCWGLKFVSKYREYRLNAIAERLASSHYSIVALQEVWVYSDFENLIEKTRDVLPYSKFYFSGVLGGGLAILSKWPIESTTMWRYPLNGRPIAFWRGDWYVGKGVASALIRHPSGQLIEVFNTHLHAPYGKGIDTYLCHRTSQAWEIGKLLRASVQRQCITIGMGDFNCQPGSMAHRLISTRGLVSDSWLANHPSSPLRDSSSISYSAPFSRRSDSPTSSFLSDAELITHLGVTCDSKLNSWRAYDLAKDMDDTSAKRLDYIWVNEGRASIEECKVVFTEPVPGLGCSYSDHFGIEVCLKIRPLSPNILESGAYGVKHEKVLSEETFDEIGRICEWYIKRERSHSYYRILHFFVSIFALIGLHIGIFWVPTSWASFIVMFAATVIGITGVLDGLIGYVFGKWEERALREFVSEVEMARQVYLGDGVNKWQDLLH